jgi:hypothetical protein
VRSNPWIISGPQENLPSHRAIGERRIVANPGARPSHDEGRSNCHIMVLAERYKWANVSHIILNIGHACQPENCFRCPRFGAAECSVHLTAHLQSRGYFLGGEGFLRMASMCI